jgi:hypothetical protein
MLSSNGRVVGLVVARFVGALAACAGLVALAPGVAAAGAGGGPGVIFYGCQLRAVCTISPQGGQPTTVATVPPSILLDGVTRDGKTFAYSLYTSPPADSSGSSPVGATYEEPVAGGPATEVFHQLGTGCRRCPRMGDRSCPAALSPRPRGP